LEKSKGRGEESPRNPKDSVGESSNRLGEPMEPPRDDVEKDLEVRVRRGMRHPFYTLETWEPDMFRNQARYIR
jgi:hypothetical protein